MEVLIDCSFQSPCYFSLPSGYCLLFSVFFSSSTLWLSDIQHCAWTWCKTCFCSKQVPHVKIVLPLEGMVNNDKGYKACRVVEFIVLYDLCGGMHILNLFQKYLA